MSGRSRAGIRRSKGLYGGRSVWSSSRRGGVRGGGGAGMGKPGVNPPMDRSELTRATSPVPGGSEPE